jgi:hypothetical protein
MTMLSPHPQGLPPMTLEQAVDLAVRMRTIQHGAGDFLARGATHDSLLDHAAHAYKAAIVLFDHCVTLETALMTIEADAAAANEVVFRLQRMMEAASTDPETGPLFRALIDPKITDGEAVGDSE